MSAASINTSQYTRKNLKVTIDGFKYDRPLRRNEEEGKMNFWWGLLIGFVIGAGLALIIEDCL